MQYAVKINMEEDDESLRDERYHSLKVVQSLKYDEQLITNYVGEKQIDIIAPLFLKILSKKYSCSYSSV